MASTMIDQNYGPGRKAIPSETLDPEKGGQAVAQAPHEERLSKVIPRSAKGTQGHRSSIPQLDSAVSRGHDRAQELPKGRPAVPIQPSDPYVKPSLSLTSTADGSADGKNVLPRKAESGETASTAGAGVRSTVLVDQDERSAVKSGLSEILEPEKRDRSGGKKRLRQVLSTLRIRGTTSQHAGHPNSPVRSISLSTWAKHILLIPSVSNGTMHTLHASSFKLPMTRAIGLQSSMNKTATVVSMNTLLKAMQDTSESTLSSPPRQDTHWPRSEFINAIVSIRPFSQSTPNTGSRIVAISTTSAKELTATMIIR